MANTWSQGPRERTGSQYLVRTAAAALALLAFSPGLILAGDGVMEINQTVADAGLPPCDLTAGLPCTISAPGSYRLTSNLETTNPDTTVLMIESDDVSVDLNGFAVLGPNECTFNEGDWTLTCTATGSGFGISAAGTDNVRVRNGSVRGAGMVCLFLEDRATIEKVSVAECGFWGIYVNHSGRVTGSSAERCNDDGINLSNFGNVAEGNTSRHNKGNGIDTGQGAVLVNNSVVENIGNGIDAGLASQVSGNTAFSNHGDGISAGTGCTVLGNTMMANDGWGISFPGSGSNPTSGFGDNVIYGNSLGAIDGQAIQLGINVCGTVPCP